MLQEVDALEFIFYFNFKVILINFVLFRDFLAGCPVVDEILSFSADSDDELESELVFMQPCGVVE